MPFVPLRRWFQFRLSTWFVLAAILAWAMTCRPYFLHYSQSGVVLLGLDDPAVKLAPGVAPFNVQPSIPYHSRVNARLRWPALALAAFLAWKAAWAVVERRRRRARIE